MNQKTGCTCNNSTSKDDQIAALGRQVRFLARTLHDHVALSESTSDRRAKELAQRLERIIGGRPVAPGDFGECCLVGNSSGAGFLNQWFCTGTLIHPRVVVSADHCIGRSTGSLDPNSVAIGIDDEDDVTPEEIVRIARIHTHPTEDIALLVLHSAVNAVPIARATSEEISSADRVELVGFGNSNPTGTLGFGTKRQVQVAMNVVREDPHEDLSSAEATLGFDSFMEFVAGRKGSGQDSCNGDSGGPAYVYVDGERKLAGATSRATDEANDNCGDGGVYVRVDAVAAWIDNVIASL